MVPTNPPTCSGSGYACTTAEYYTIDFRQKTGWDSGFPVSSRYAPPAPLQGTVHWVRVDTPGSHRPDPADEVRAALHSD